MKGNQGLEALAALCGGQSEAPTENKGTRLADSSSQRRDGPSGSGGNNFGASQQGSSTTSQRQSPLAQQSPLHNLTQQQWQQAVAAASSLQSSGANQSSLAQSLLLSGLTPQGLGDNTYSVMQQYAFQLYSQAQAKLSAAQQAATVQSLGPFGDANQHALVMALAGKAQQLQQSRGFELPKPNLPQHKVMPSANIVNNNHVSIASASTSGDTPAPLGSPAVSSSTNMKPPLPPSTSQTMSPAAGILNQATSHQTIAPMPGSKALSDSESTHDFGGPGGDKKHMKRAANRKSAQLSRKRKKQFIEELKEENDELRRKEQILRSIPDLIVVFDSSGKLGFVSQSVSRFLDIPAEKLEGTSFWDRMCGDSVRLLKAAFMDSLAARTPDSDSAPLGSGVWELRLVDKESKYVVVTMNGVVHFTGDAPECVCCIRPRDQKSIQELPKERKHKTPKPHSRLVSSSDGSRTSEDSDGQQARIRVNPNQSVISNDVSTEENSAEDSSPQEDESSPRKKNRRSTHGEIRLMDGVDSGCEVSESSGSDDGIASS